MSRIQGQSLIMEKICNGNPFTCAFHSDIPSGYTFRHNQLNIEPTTLYNACSHNTPAYRRLPAYGPDIRPQMLSYVSQ